MTESQREGKGEMEAAVLEPSQSRGGNDCCLCEDEFIEALILSVPIILVLLICGLILALPLLLAQVSATC